MSLLFGFIMAPQHHTSTFACRAVGENKPQKMNDFRRESFLLTHASTSRLSGFCVAKATRNLPAIRWLYVIYQYIRWVKKSTSFQFCAANLQKLFQTTIIPPPHFQIFLPPLSFKIVINARFCGVQRRNSRACCSFLSHELKIMITLARAKSPSEMAREQTDGSFVPVHPKFGLIQKSTYFRTKHYSHYPTAPSGPHWAVRCIRRAF